MMLGSINEDEIISKKNSNNQVLNSFCIVNVI